jgi:hypothetical protein
VLPGGHLTPGVALVAALVPAALAPLATVVLGRAAKRAAATRRRRR